LFYFVATGDRTCDCAATTRYRNFGITSTSFGGLYHRKKKDLSSLDFTLINIAVFKATFCHIPALLTKNLTWICHLLRAVTIGTRSFWQWTQLMNWGYHFFFLVICTHMNDCSYFLRIIYICLCLMWEIQYAVESVCTSLTIISVPVPMVQPFFYREIKTFWCLIHMNYINHACMLIAPIHFVFQYPKSLNVRYLPDNFEHYTRRFRRKGQCFWRW
jgi:hypothetical protein